MLKAIILTYNPSNYSGGNYHKDLLAALMERYDSYVYGPGIPKGQNKSDAYKDYSTKDTFADVVRKSPWEQDEIDLVICTTLWDRPGQVHGDNHVDPHPNIRLKDFGGKKIFFLNKEYINLDSKLEYAYLNEFDLIVTVLPEKKYKQWKYKGKGQFIQSHFGISNSFFKTGATEKKYDLMFTGSLHKKYTTVRADFKESLFKHKSIPTNRGLIGLLPQKLLLNERFNGVSVYWAEWSRFSIGWNLKTLLPSGEGYAELMRQSRFVFNSLSAEGILGTRFFEVMASGSVNLVPQDDYYDVLIDGVNCVMYDDLRSVPKKIKALLNNPPQYETIISNGLRTAVDATYAMRLKVIEEHLFRMADE